MFVLKLPPFFSCCVGEEKGRQFQNKHVFHRSESVLNIVLALINSVFNSSMNILLVWADIDSLYDLPLLSYDLQWKLLSWVIQMQYKYTIYH